MKTSLMQAYFKAVRAYQVRETRSIIFDCSTSECKILRLTAPTRSLIFIATA